MWPVALSGRLPVVALVGHYPTNKLIGREHIPDRKTFHHQRCLRWSYPVLIPVSRSYPRVKGRLLTCYSPVRRSSTPKGLSARLACVKHAASVRPEPGSNSPLMSINNRQPLQSADCQHTESTPSNSLAAIIGSDHGLNNSPSPRKPRTRSIDEVCASSASGF